MANATLDTPRLHDVPDQLTTADGVPLKRKLAISMRRARMRAFLMTAPLVLFMLISFVLPIGQMLTRSVYNDSFSKALPNFSEALRNWDQAASPDGLPDEALFKLLAEDMTVARAERTIGRAATRINYDHSGTRSLFMSAARKAKRLEAPYKENILALKPKWSDTDMWAAMKRVANDTTPGFYLAAVDRTFNADGEIIKQAEVRQIYVKLFWRTLWLSAVITLLCFILAYPIAYLLSVLPLAKSNLLMILVLLPFWTSLLVRTTAWIALLQTEGIVNDVLVSLGIISDDGRVQMIYNQMGTIVAMTHILLPFMVLPLYSVMKTIPPSYMRAARSLGADQLTAFLKVYFPQTIPGIAAGTLLVFILAIGYYITPALVGGQDGQLISNIIAFHMQRSLNWSLAAALGSILLASVLILYWLYNKLVGIDNLKFG
ncbi:MAG: ABC transporter permease [Pseudomonadota bacterium]